MKKALALLLCLVMAMACMVPAVSALTPSGNNIKFRGSWTNDPNYQFSEAYKTSVWYENFTALELTQSERNNVLRIAISQLGYHEGDSPADFNGMNTNGSSNYIEYARLVVPNYNNNAYAWCACFVNWCLSQAGVDHAYGEISCQKWVEWLKPRKMFQNSIANGGDYTPLPGDFVFFEWNDGANDADHIGFVLYTTETHVYTIEGNTSGGVVTIKNYALNDSCLIGYGTPKYKENNEATIDFSFPDGLPLGQYVVNNANAYLYATADTSKRLCKVPLGHRVVVTSVEGDYAKVIYGDKEGYIPTNILVFFAHAQTSTITLDFNGNGSSPLTTEVVAGTTYTLPTNTPIKENDNFVGWATRPYDVAVTYHLGDTIPVTKDLTLYAVWEKHSMDLAADAMANGTFVNYPRPATITNHRALIPAAISTEYLQAKNTKVTIVNDSTYGNVLALASASKIANPSITIPYADLMREARLSIVIAEEIQYIVLRVKNLSLSNPIMDLYYECGEDPSTITEGRVTALTAADENWQYVIFDMTEAEGWTSAIQNLRLVYERQAQAADETVYLSDIFFLKSEAEKNAVVTDGLYPFAAQEKMPPSFIDPLPETEAETEVVTENETNLETDTETNIETSVDISTNAPQETTLDTVGETEADTSEGGCSSVVVAGILPVMLMGAFSFLFKKKED